MALSLATMDDWFTPRVSACGLFACSMSKLIDGDAAAAAAAVGGATGGANAGAAASKDFSGAKEAKELRDAFKSLAADEAPMVRRAAALQLCDFARSLGPPNHAAAVAAAAAAAEGGKASEGKAAEGVGGGAGGVGARENVAEEMLPLYRALLADEQVDLPLRARVRACVRACPPPMRNGFAHGQPPRRI